MDGLFWKTYMAEIWLTVKLEDGKFNLGHFWEEESHLEPEINKPA